MFLTRENQLWDLKHMNNRFGVDFVVNEHLLNDFIVNHFLSREHQLWDLTI